MMNVTLSVGQSMSRIPAYDHINDLNDYFGETVFADIPIPVWIWVGALRRTRSIAWLAACCPELEPIMVEIACRSAARQGYNAAEVVAYRAELSSVPPQKRGARLWRDIDAFARLPSRGARGAAAADRDRLAQRADLENLLCPEGTPTIPKKFPHHSMTWPHGSEPHTVSEGPK